MRRTSNLSLVAALISIILVHGSAAGDDLLTYGMDLGVGESDNVTLVSTDKVRQTMAIADADFTVQQQSRLLDVHAKGNFSYLDFLQGAYGPELIGRFDGLGRVALWSDRLSWTLQDDFGQAQINPFTPVTPTNREDINYLSTGPDLDLRLSGLTFVDATARYARTQYQTSPYDSNRFTGSLAFGEALSPVSKVSVDVTSERVLFDNTLLNVDFDRSSYYVNYTLDGLRTGMKLNVGATSVDQAAAVMTGPLARLELSRKVSAASQIIVQLGREITDGSSGFSALQPGALGSVGTASAALTQSSNNYAASYASAAWTFTRDRTSLRMSARWERDLYDGQSHLDLNRGNAEVNLSRRITRLLSVQLLGSLDRSDYTQVDYSERDTLVGGALTLDEGRGLEIRLRYDHASRSVSGVGSGYQENRAFLTIGYRPRREPSASR